MSSSIAAEKTPLGSRAILVLSVFTCIGLGAFTSSIVYLILLAAFKSSIRDDINNLEWVWRLLMGLGKFSWCKGFPVVDSSKRILSIQQDLCRVPSRYMPGLP